LLKLMDLAHKKARNLTKNLFNSLVVYA